MALDLTLAKKKLLVVLLVFAGTLLGMLEKVVGCEDLVAHFAQHLAHDVG